ncbi:hypothetical protein ACLK2I_13495 [Escherichia coli]
MGLVNDWAMLVRHLALRRMGADALENICLRSNPRTASLERLSACTQRRNKCRMRRLPRLVRPTGLHMQGG